MEPSTSRISLNKTTSSRYKSVTNEKPIVEKSHNELIAITGPNPQVSNKRRLQLFIDEEEVDEICVLCSKPFLDNDDIQAVLSKGRKIIIEISELKRDGIKELILEKESFTVHAKCRVEYTRKDDVQPVLNKGRKTANDISESKKDDISEQLLHKESSVHSPIRRPKKKTTRNVQQGSATQELDGKRCILCLESIPDNFKEIQKAKHPSKRDHLREVISIRDKMMDIASRRGDDVGVGIVERITKNSGFFNEFHQKCYKLFCIKSKRIIDKTPSSRDKLAESMENIYNFLENAYDCQFSMQDLLDAAGEYQPSVPSIKTHLLDHYGVENIRITSGYNMQTTVSLSKPAQRIPSDNYTVLPNRTADERKALVEEVAKIIRGDICSKYYDTTVPCTIVDNAEDDVPELLQLLLQGIIIEGRKGCTSAMKIKCTAIGHAIIAVTRPNSFNSAVLFAVSSYIQRKFSSKNAIDNLSALGFGTSYHDMGVLHNSDAAYETKSMQLSSFLQSSANNAAFNSDDEVDAHAHIMF